MMKWPIPCIVLSLCIAPVLANPSRAQSAAASNPSPRLEFVVASVRENKSAEKPRSNFPLNPGPQFTPSAGVLSAHNMLLLQYMVFALKPTSYQLQAFRGSLPEWARTAHFDIEARAEGNPTKDQMRQMMVSLLQHRFHMKVHHENREVPVFALVLARPGRLGPKLAPHPADDPDCTKTPLPPAIANGYPAACGAGASTVPSAPGLTAIAGRKVTMASFVLGLTQLDNSIDRPVIDATGLPGAFDYAFEWAPEGDAMAPPPEAVVASGFLSALREQLGLKLQPQKGTVDLIVLDGVERPSDN